MSRNLNFEQLYFTNYQGTQQFEGASSGAAVLKDSMLYLSDTWFLLAKTGPCAGVFYNEKLRRYTACFVRDVSEKGDTRLRIWVHAAIPESDDDEGLRACLAWPFSRFRQSVSLGGELETVAISGGPSGTYEAREKYDLKGRRLACLLKMVYTALMKANGQLRIGIGSEDPDLPALYEEACAVMHFIRSLVPGKLNGRLGFAAGRHVREADTPFIFEPCGPGRLDLKGSLGEDDMLTGEELTDHAFLALADLYERSPEAFEGRVNRIFEKKAADPVQLAWNYYMTAVEAGEDIKLPQPLLIKEIKTAEMYSRKDQMGMRLLCRMLSMIDTTGRPPQFCRTVLDKYIVAAASLGDHSCREYEDSFTGIVKVLRDFCGDSDSIVSDTTRYLKWMKQSYPDYYRDFTEGLYRQCDSENDRRAVRLLLAGTDADADAAGAPEVKRIRPEEIRRSKDEEGKAETKRETKAPVKTQTASSWAAAFAGAGFLAGILADQFLGAYAGRPVMLAAGALVCVFGIGVKFFDGKRR